MGQGLRRMKARARTNTRTTGPTPKTRPGVDREDSEDRARQGKSGRTENRSDHQGLRDALQNLIDLPETPASAKISAARTIAEMQGMIGRHQVRPAASQRTPASELTRDELAAELNRLRTLVNLGLFPSE
jgi:hypothetical protein